MHGLGPPGPFLAPASPVPVALGAFAGTELTLVPLFPEGYIRHGELLEEGRGPRDSLASCWGVVLPKWQPEHESSNGIQRPPSSVCTGVSCLSPPRARAVALSPR